MNRSVSNFTTMSDGSGGKFARRNYQVPSMGSLMRFAFLLLASLPRLSASISPAAVPEPEPSLSHRPYSPQSEPSPSYRPNPPQPEPISPTHRPYLSIDKFRARPSCVDKLLYSREENADCIFTGTIKALEPDPDSIGGSKVVGQRQRAQVDVKRVLKGSEIMDRLPEVYSAGNFVSMPRRLVTVRGMGRADVCHGEGAVHDTYILFTRWDGGEGLVLNSSLLRLTLDNIAMTDAAVHDKPWIPKQRTNKEDPCRLVFCPYGAQCVHAPGGAPPQCRCVEECSVNDTYAPVCGSDDVTYTSECRLRAARCAQQRRIVILRRTHCDVPDPCAEQACTHSAQCVAALDGQSARCVCAFRCRAVSELTSEDLVCGTDGIQYASLCHLQNASCRAMRDIRVKASGKCETVDECRECKYGARCVPGGGCGCPTACPEQESPVCASDQATYSNECHMLRAACHYNVTLRVVREGDCEERSNSPDVCDESMCQFGGMCQLDEHRLWNCVCNFYCNSTSSPTCGSDGTVYPNLCLLHEATCRMQALVSIQPMNFCQRLSNKSAESEVCHCHPLGSLGPACDPATRQCPCRDAVGGQRCDRCEPNYWGLPLISDSGNPGCTACGCDEEGSIREDCDQTTGACVCKQNWTGDKCDSPVNGSMVRGSSRIERHNDVMKSWPDAHHQNHGWVIPSFSGESHLALRRLHHGGKELAVELEFIPRERDGVLLYTGQHASGLGDFLALSLQDGHVVFSYDLGSGPLTLRSPHPVTLDLLHHVTAKRHGPDGFLQLDEGDEVSGLSRGQMRTLNIGTPLYLGYVPNISGATVTNIGTDVGFVGCVQSLRIANSELNKDYDLRRATSPDIQGHSDVTECTL